jgi:predicted DNA-binding WGR domain protein
MSDLGVSAKFMAHEGGTKFYEVVALWNESEKRGALVRRWGKTSARVGGGEIKIEPYGLKSQLDTSLRAALAEKSKRGYLERPFEHVGKTIHGVVMCDGPNAFIEVARSTYGANIMAVLKSVFSEASGSSADEEDIVVEEPVKVVKPEPVRSQDWASW